MSVLDTPQRTAIHNLYAEHHGWLKSWLRARLGNSSDAADFAHDTFIRVMQRCDQIAIETPRAFLRTVARGLVIDHWRREELQRAWLESIAHLPEAEAPSPEEQELVLELLERIATLLDGLKPRVRTAFLLSQCEGLAYKDIAERLGVSVRSVERYISDGLYHCYLLRYGDESDQ